MKLEFEFIDFTPRKDFKSIANHSLTRLYEKMPSNTVCEAACTYYSTYYFFQIVFYNNEERFEAQCILNPRKENTSKRDWQSKALQKMEVQMEEKVLKWLDQRDTDALNREAA